MEAPSTPVTNDPNKPQLNLAIVGGGRACKFFLQLLEQKSLPYLKVKLLGVCDINPQAEGLLMAREMGIFTTDNFKDFFEFKELDGIIELTNSREVLIELVHLRPKRVGIIEHNIGRFLRSYFLVEQQLKSAEQQVVMEKMISDFLIRQTRQKIIILNPDFTIADVNDACLEDLGLPKEEVLGAYCYRVIHGLEVPCSAAEFAFECPVLETLRTGESSHVIHEDPNEREQTAYMNIVAYPVKNGEGDVVRVIEIWSDITREISSRMEERVRVLKSDLNRLVQEDRLISLGKLVASCVHEINNPIQGLLTFSELIEETLAEGPPSPQELKKLRHICSMMTNELERCGKIVSGLLSFSRESAVGYHDLNLNGVLDSVTSLTRHKMELQNIELCLDLSPELLIVNGDANRLQQCFLNLLFNAIEALPDGGDLTVATLADHENKKAVVQVNDSGYGIPERHLDHVFDPFFTTKEAGEGTGLGLSIVYGVVKNHGGSIEVQSEEGQGTSFVLSFPREGC